MGALAEPVRSESLTPLREYTRTSIAISGTVPGTPAHERTVAASAAYQDRLWALAGQTLDTAPADSARRYVETLNEMFDAQADRVYGLTNRVPTTILVLQVAGAAVAMAVLALHLATSGRGVPTVLIASALVTVLLVVTFDLDRPTRGLIRVPPTPRRRGHLDDRATGRDRTRAP